MRIDPRKAAIVLLLVYGGLLVWILPPLEELRWNDEVSAQGSAVAEGSPTGNPQEGGGPGKQSAVEGADPAADGASQPATFGKGGGPAGIDSNVDQRKSAGAGGRAPKGKGDGPAAVASLTESAQLEFSLIPDELTVAGGIVRLEVAGGAGPQKTLAAWLSGLGGPPRESDLFGATGVPIDDRSSVSVRVPPNLIMRAICQIGNRSEVLRVKPLKPEAVREIAIEFAPELDDVQVAKVHESEVVPDGVAAVDASAKIKRPRPPVADRPMAEPAATDGVESVSAQTEESGDSIAPDAEIPTGDAPGDRTSDSVDESTDDTVDRTTDMDTPVLVPVDTPVPDQPATGSSSPVDPVSTESAAFGEADGESPARLRGFLLDQDGQGVGGISIWLVIPWGASDNKPRRMRFEDRVRAEVRTETDGSFAFAEVADGRWLVGVAPGGTARAPVAATEISRIARAVKLKRGQASAEVVLRIGRGLRLSGLIEDSSGEPASFLSVSATEEDVAGGLWTRTAVDGTFDVGPLGPGSCWITVRVSDEGEQTFGPFEAGSGDVLIRLRAAAGVEGTVLDEAGQRATTCWIHVLRPFAEPPVLVSSHEVSGGRFDVTELELGVYRLVATAEGHRIALSSDIDLRSEEHAQGVELVLADGAEIVVQLRGGKEPTTVAVAQGARAVTVASVTPGDVWSQTVPAGALSVSLLSPVGVVLDQARLVAVPGERYDVIFDLD